MRALPGTPVGGLFPPRLPSTIGVGPTPYGGNRFMSPNVGRVAAAPMVDHLLRGTLVPKNPPGLFLPIGGRECFWSIDGHDQWNVIDYNAVTKKSLHNEHSLNNRLRPKQRLGKQKTVKWFLETQIGYENRVITTSQGSCATTCFRRTGLLRNTFCTT